MDYEDGGRPAADALRRLRCGMTSVFFAVGKPATLQEMSGVASLSLAMTTGNDMETDN